MNGDCHSVDMGILHLMIYLIFLNLIEAYETSFDEYDEYWNSREQRYHKVNPTRTVAQGCRLDLNEDLPKKNEPLFLRRVYNSFKLLLPTMKARRGIIQLRKNEKITISCPGKNNFIQAIESVQSEGFCVTGTKLFIEGSNIPAKNLNCNSRVAATALPIMNKKCARGKGIIVEIGYDVGDWIPLVESCHNVASSHTYYSRHVIYGAMIGGKVKRTTERPQFSRGDDRLYKNFDPNKSYTKKLGMKYAKKYLGSPMNFLAKGHLAPDADFIFSAHQFSTYFFVNAAPQWQAINAGNWYRTEVNARDIAKDLSIDLEVVTGTEGILELEGEEIWLEDSRLPVPNHFWKILRDPEDGSCIAFVSTNNPFLTQKPRTICQNICAKNGWPSFLNDLSKGYVYCCTYQALRKAVPVLPFLSCKHILQRIDK